MKDYKYIYPPNAKKQEQLDIMMDLESKGLDPLDIEYIDQDILFKTDYWYVSENRFPYDEVERQFLIASLHPVYKIDDMSEEMWSDLKSIWIRLETDYNIPGGALCFRFGDPALSNASLKRLHAHVIMPKHDDNKRHKVSFSIGGHKELREGLHIKND